MLKYELTIVLIYVSNSVKHENYSDIEPMNGGWTNDDGEG